MSERTSGILFALFSAAVWSILPLITSGRAAILPPLFYASLSTFAAAIFFAVLITVKRQWSALRFRETWFDLFVLAFLNGAVFHGGVFIASPLTAPGNTTLLLQMEIFFSIVILRMWGKESLTRKEVIGAICMLCGAVVIVWPQSGVFSIKLGDMILLGCTLVPPIANVSAKRARSKISGIHVIAIRSFMAGVMLLLVSLMLESAPSVGTVGIGVPLVLINGVLIMGIGKLAWVEAIHRIPISVGVSLGASAPAMTLLLAFVFLGTPPSLQQWIALVLITAGILAITYKPGT